MTVHEIATFFKTSNSTVSRIVYQFKSSGTVVTKHVGGNRAKFFSVNILNEIKSLIENDCSLTLSKIQNLIETKYGIKYSISTLHRKIDNFNYTLKRVSLVTETRNSPSTIEKRFEYARDFYQMNSEYQNLKFMFLDEVGFNSSLRCKRGRALRGRCAVQRVRCIRSRNLSVCCAMTKHGTFHATKQIMPFNRISFLQFINEVIDKITNELGCQKVVFVLDNVRFHRVPEVTERIVEAGHSVKFLPPYSPFLNPIENMFTQWKQLVRAERPTNEENLMVVIDRTYRLVTEENCNSYYSHMLRFLPACLDRNPIEDETLFG
jgi:transposase